MTTRSRRHLYKIVVHLDSEGGWVHNGPRIPPALLDRVCCDGVIQPLWAMSGLPINLGRARHIVPLRTRIVVEDRDRLCRHPSCTSRVGLEVHHLIHWADGGRSDTTNLCCLCRKHHHAHHRGELTITGDANQINGLTFYDRHGNRIKPCGTPTPPGHAPPHPPPQPYHHPTGERLNLHWLDFTTQPPHPPPGAQAPSADPPQHPPHDSNNN